MQYVMLVVLVAFIVVAVVIVKKTLDKMKDADGGVVVPTTNMKTAQEFLPFADIVDDVIDLGGFKYRMIIECGSTNYNLKTNTEKQIIEDSFRKFLNSVTYPISIYIHTKEINYGNMLNSLRTDIDEVEEIYPQLRQYAEYYYEQVKNLKKSINNTKQKKKYIIVPYEEAITMNQLNPDEKKSMSIDEIQTRAKQIAAGVSGMGLTARILTTQDMIELFYSLNHRDDDSFLETVSSGEYLTDVVTDGKEPHKADELEQAITIIQEAENKFKIRILDHQLPIEATELFNAITQDMAKMKRGLMDIEANGGYESLKSIEDLFNEADEVTLDPITGEPEIPSEEDNPVMLNPDDFRDGGDM